MKDHGSEQRSMPPAVAVWKARVLSFLKELGIVLGAFLVLNNFVIASFMVPTGSMENEVMTGDFLFVNKFIYGGTSPRNIPFTNVRLPWFRVPAIRDVHHGDVIVFVFPGYRDEVMPEDFQFYLKRCVGIPGDTIQVKERVLYVNGEIAPLPRNLKLSPSPPLPPDLVNDQIFPPGAPWNEDNYGPLVIPKKGMAIPISAENFDRWKTFIRREGHAARLTADGVQVDGKTTTEYVVERDYYFGMGDNRNNSLDSRFWGFIPDENIVGSPIIVYWSWDSDIPLSSIFQRLASVRLNRIGVLIK